MFTWKPVREKTGLDEAIDELCQELKGYTADNDKYANVVTQIERLQKVKALDKPNRLSRDTLAIVLGNVAAVVIIVGYERTNIMASKALNLLTRAPLNL